MEIPTCEHHFEKLGGRCVKCGSTQRDITFGPGYFSDAELEQHAIDIAKKLGRNPMTDKIAGYLEVGLNDNNEIVINHPDLKPDENGVGHIVFSVNQAENFSKMLAEKASEASKNIWKKENEARRKAAEAIPVDRAAKVLTDGSPVTEDHLKLKPNGQQEEYVVLTAEERAKGFVRPVRRTYRHLKCGESTTMSHSIAETYARDPKFYGGTFCCGCGKHFALNINGEPQFFWIDDNTAVGS